MLTRRFVHSIVTASLLSAALTACSVPDVAKLGTESESFAKDTVEKVGKSWDAHIATQRADATLAAAGDPAPLFKIFAEKLGPITQVKELRRDQFKAMAGIGSHADYTALYKCDVDCKAGPATVDIGVSHIDNRWYLTVFSVNSPALQAVNHQDEVDAQSYVTKTAPGICENLGIDALKPFADPVLAAELADGGKTAAAGALFFSIGKALGHFKKCGNFAFAGWSLVNGKYVYNFVAPAHFERGKARVRMLTCKTDGKWQLRGFNIQAHS